MNKENTFRVCAECVNFDPYFEEIEVLHAGDETLHRCPSCGAVEGKTKLVDSEGNDL